MRRCTPLTNTQGCPRALHCREAGCSTTSKGISLWQSGSGSAREGQRVSHEVGAGWPAGQTEQLSCAAPSAAHVLSSAAWQLPAAATASGAHAPGTSISPAPSRVDQHVATEVATAHSVTTRLKDSLQQSSPCGHSSELSCGQGVPHFPAPEPGGSARCYWNGCGSSAGHPAQGRTVGLVPVNAAALIQWQRCLVHSRPVVLNPKGHVV